MRIKVSWRVIVAGYVDVEADTDKDAEMIAQAILGTGISIASNLHAPPGIEIRSKTEVVKDETSRLVIPNNVKVGPDGNITPIRPGVA